MAASYQPDIDYVVKTVNATVVRLRQTIQGGPPSGGLEDGVDMGAINGNPNGAVIGYVGDVRFQQDEPTLWFKFNAALDGTDQGWVALDAGNVAAAIAALQAAVAAIQAQLIVMQAGIDANTAAILVLQGQVAVLQGNLAALAASVGVLQTQIQAPFLTVGGSGLLTNERAIAPSGGLGFTDNGPNSTYDVFIATNGVTNAMLAQMAANTVKVNATAALADPQDLAVGTNTVLGRVGANIVAAQLVTAQIADDQVTNAKLANMPAGTVKMNPTAAPGDPQDVAPTAAGQSLVSQADGTVIWTGVSGAQVITGRTLWEYDLATEPPATVPNGVLSVDAATWGANAWTGVHPAGTPIFDFDGAGLSYANDGTLATVFNAITNTGARIELPLSTIYSRFNLDSRARLLWQVYFDVLNPIGLDAAAIVAAYGTAADMGNGANVMMSARRLRSGVTQVSASLRTQGGSSAPSSNYTSAPGGTANVLAVQVEPGNVAQTMLGVWGSSDGTSPPSPTPGFNNTGMIPIQAEAIISSGTFATLLHPARRIAIGFTSAATNGFTARARRVRLALMNLPGLS